MGFVLKHYPPNVSHVKEWNWTHMHTKLGTDASLAVQSIGTSDLSRHLAIKKKVHNKWFHQLSTKISFATVGHSKPP
jgi:hypothetical protein